MNVYDMWVLMHFKRICSAIDQIQIQHEFDNSGALVEIGFSQELESNQLAQPNTDLATIAKKQKRAR